MKITLTVEADDLTPFANILRSLRPELLLPPADAHTSQEQPAQDQSLSALHEQPMQMQRHEQSAEAQGPLMQSSEAFREKNLRALENARREKARLQAERTPITAESFAAAAEKYPAIWQRLLSCETRAGLWSLGYQMRKKSVPNEIDQNSFETLYTAAKRTRNEMPIAD